MEIDIIMLIISGFGLFVGFILAGCFLLGYWLSPSIDKALEWMKDKDK